MSAVLGMVQLDGAALPTSKRSRLSAVLASPHCERLSLWADRCAALGHALMRIGDRADLEQQPLVVTDAEAERAVVVQADARLDARADLTRALGRTLTPATTDVELIGQAFLRWGSRCVDHLLGDYAFAIWDPRNRTLFCGRDHMGVRPFFYAVVSGALVFGNSLAAVRRQSGASDALNDLAIADLLLFGCNQDASTTAFDAVRRLPAAHTLTWRVGAAAPSVAHYWTMPIDEPVYYRRSSDYVERFRELLDAAVADRLPKSGRVGIFMSGGLDSPALAATAARLSRAAGTPDGVRAFTFGYESLFADPERGHAESAASHLGVPLTFIPVDACTRWTASLTVTTPEPLDDPSDRADWRAGYAAVAHHSRVAFHGEGPDNALLYEWKPHVAALTRSGRWSRLGLDFLSHARHHRRLPLLPSLPRMVRQRESQLEYAQRMPSWMAPELTRRLNLEERWRSTQGAKTTVHPTRPRGYASLASPLWQSLFESLEPSYTGAPLQVRHPYCDIRFLRFMLSVPAIPWCRNKHILRKAMQGVLPMETLTRTKTPLAGEPLVERVKLAGWPAVHSSERLATYVEPARWPERSGPSVSSIQADLRVAALGQWLSALNYSEPSVLAEEIA